MGSKRAALLTVAALGVIVAARCGGPADAGKEGAECFRAEECAAGLVCVEQRCTSDLTSVNIRADGGFTPPEAAPPP